MIANKDKIDILLNEYDHRFQEIMNNSKIYNQQVNYINMFLTGILGIITIVFTKKDVLDLSTINIYIIPFLLIFILIFVNFLFNTLNDSLLWIFLNGARIAVIEKKINEYVNDDLLIWDSSIVPTYQNIKNRFFRTKGLKSNYLSGFYTVLIMLFVYGLLSFLCYYLSNYFFIYFIILEILFIILNLIQIIHLGSGLDTMEKIVKNKKIE